MPAYEFHCKNCGKKVTLVLSISEYTGNKAQKCPKCGSKKLERRITSFQVQTSKKS